MASNWEKVGLCLVDAGCVMLVDPCYVLPREGDPRPGGDYEDFMDEATNREFDKHGTMAFQGGVVVSSGYGDGAYPVHIRRNIEGRVAEVRITFIGDDDEDSDESGP